MTATALPVPELIPARLLTRISHDRTGKRVGVTRQRAEGHALAGKLSWAIEREHCDNDKSAWRDDVERDGFNALVADIEAGLVHAVIAFDLDRISRQDWQAMYFRRLCIKHGVRVAFVTKGREIDIESPYEWALDSVRADQESTVKSKRVRAASEERAMAGKAAGRVLYGWQRVIVTDQRGNKIDWHDEPHPEHAAIVREIADRLLAGEKLRRIAADLNERSIPVPNAGRKNAASQWNVTTLRNLVRRPANIGQRVHRGKVLDGVTAEAQPILDRDTYENVCALLADPKRRTIDDNRVRHLLTNIARCGVCGGPVRRKRKQARDSVWEAYVCADIGCVGRRQELVDELVTETVLARLESGDARELLAEDTGSEVAAAAAEAETLRARLDNAADEYADGVLDAASYKRIRERIAPKLRDAEARATVTVSPGRGLAYALATGRTPRVRWSKLGIEQQRAIIAALLDITIMPTANPRVFNPADVRCDWRA